ncbi:MAG TPA: RHS repeat-associated core domain-containing protein, partial [Steroidobacteraceae bacterium]|nr:RHS repeat-associated core domain-containing protein [Steroidobacteraceae bacterium]
MKKTTGGSSRYFVYDESGHLVGEYSNSGALIQETVWFGDIPVATLKPNGSGVDVFYVHTDHLNTPRRISRPSDNAVVWRWDSDPFATTGANEDPDGDSSLFSYNLRFPGQYFDGETGLHYNYRRDYDPAKGGYVQSDPIGLEGGLNTYLYAGANPALFTDPRGLFLWLVPAAVATEEAAVGAIATLMVAVKGYEVLKNPLPDPAPDAANDPEYGDDDCPSDCRTWRTALNLMYQSLSRMQTFPRHFSPEFL